MSATGRGGDRDKLDRYYTPDGLAEACVAVLKIRPGCMAYDPHVGGGAFARALVKAGARAVFVSDIDPEAPGLVGGANEAPMCIDGVMGIGCFDFLNEAQLRAREASAAVKLIVGNPPYKDAEAHVRAAIQHMLWKFGTWEEVEAQTERGVQRVRRPVFGSAMGVVAGSGVVTSWRVAFVLRLGFLASAKRRGLFEQYPPEAVWVIPERPSFTGDGEVDSTDYALFVWGGEVLAQAKRPELRTVGGMESKLRWLPKYER